MKNRAEFNSFLQGYLDAALFTTDQDAPGGCDYVESGRADEMYASLPDYFIEQAQADSVRFESEQAVLLAQAGDSWQNGSDLWYTRNGHGVGFWDRGYADEVAKPLTTAAHAMGGHDLMPDEIG